LGLVAVIVAPPASEQLMFVGEAHAAGMRTLLEPDPLATAIVVVFVPCLKST
jgi:hypothetical protein